MPTPASPATTPMRVPAARLRDWQPRLSALIAQRMQHPLQWGVHDCCLWAADAVHAVTGTDLAAPWRGTYTTQAGADALLQQLGGLVQLAVQHLGPAVHTSMAQAGDVGLASVAGTRALVVCGGAHFLAVAAAGLEAVPMASVARAWRCTVPQGPAHG